MMCKRPAPGVGKQRIAAEFGCIPTASLCQKLLACAIEDLQGWPFARAISVASADDVTWAKTLINDATVVAQPEGNLGERLAHTHNALAAPGQPVLFIGSDAPTLDNHYLLQCLDALTRFDVVLGQADDGGVTVMGSRTGWPNLAQLPWSTEHLGRALHDACTAEGLSVALHSPLQDIDTMQQLLPLAETLASDSRLARQALRAWITDNVRDTRETTKKVS